MRKKGLVAAALLAAALRCAVLAGAGEPVERFLRAHLGDGELVNATLRIELGARPGAAENEAAPPEAEPLTEAPDAAEAPDGIEAPDAAPLVPEPTPDAPEASAPADTPTPTLLRAYDLSGAAAVQNNSGLAVDLDALAAEGLTLTLPAEGPQVLIFHTHTSEAYTPDGADRYVASDPYRTEDLTQSVVRVGDALAAALEAHGLTVLHDREVYDYPSYTGSYSRSGASVERYLAEYPTLRVVIDLHRDALGDGDVVYKTKAVLDGRTCAQAMLLVGTGANGLSHPAWRENCKLALYLQAAATGRWPSLMRPVDLVAERYNQQLSTGMFILEVGSTGNTLREAVAAVEAFGDAAGAALAQLVAVGE